MKSRTSTLLFIIALWVYSDAYSHAQHAMFEQTVYFEDGIGNRDSLIIGGDTTAALGLNPEFGEIPITTPFDSVFEVRAISEQEWWKPEPYFLKKFIGWSEKVLNFPEACENIEFVRFVIQIKHLPLKVYWDSSIYSDSLCILGSYLTSGAYAITIGPWTLDLNPENENLAYCVAQHDSVILNIGEGLYPGNLYNEFIYEVEGGTFDTMLILEWDFDYAGSSLVCGDIVSTPSIKKDDFSFSLYPVPASTELIIEWASPDIVPDQILAYNMHGQKMTWEYSDSALHNHFIPVEISSWMPGFYFVQMIAQGKVYTRKFIKV